MKRNLQAVATLVEDSPFSEHQIRWWIFQADANGLAQADAVVRVGRRVYIDVDAFDRWIDSQNPSSAANSISPPKPAKASLSRPATRKRAGGAT